MWKKDSWKNFEALHIPKYEDLNELNDVLNTLRGFPPLVFAGEVRSLRKSLGHVAEGNAFYYKEVIAQKAFQSFVLIIFVIHFE